MEQIAESFSLFQLLLWQSLKGIKECTKFVKISTIAVQSRYKFYQCHETSWNKKENNENLKIFKISMLGSKDSNDNFTSWHIFYIHPVYRVSG